MIQGVHANSVVFIDLHTAAGALARLGERLPGIDGSGHRVDLGDATWILRIGGVRPERHALCCGLQLAPVDEPFRPQLKGGLRFQEVPGRARIKASFEGASSRAPALLPAMASTEDVRHAANEHARRILDLIVNALESLAEGRPQTRSAVGS